MTEYEAEYEPLLYSFNLTNKHFINYSKPYWLNKLPDVLQLKTIKGKSKLFEPNKEKDKTGFFIELNPTESNKVFYGNDSYNKPNRNSFILFFFHPVKKHLTCFFFNNFTPNNVEKEIIIRDAIRGSIELFKD